jgi:hypothetical protein
MAAVSGALMAAGASPECRGAGLHVPLRGRSMCRRMGGPDGRTGSPDRRMGGPRHRTGSPGPGGCTGGGRDGRTGSQTVAQLAQAVAGRAQAVAWAQPCSPARTNTLTQRSQRAESDRERTHGRSPVWRAHPGLVPLATCRDATQTPIWAKPCLAGRPSALVRTQFPEQNTSRGRPTGMELPDYPVMALTPTPQDQDGPALPLPAGSFPVLVPRYASRRVCFGELVPRSASRRFSCFSRL